MKFIKLFESFEDIHTICKEYDINDYTINSDGTIDVVGDVSLNSMNLTKLPLKFGKVDGGFYCYSNNLISLEGCTQSVSGNFECNHNKLITLEGCPQSVGLDFDCQYNQLTTLEFCPKSVFRDFSFHYNQLKDLYGFPEFFDNDIYHHSNPVSEILNLFNTYRLGKVVDLLNEYGVIQQNGKVVILDRLEEVFHTLNMEIPKEINLENYEVY